MFFVMTIGTLISILLLIKRKVIGPIEELTFIIQNGGKSQHSVEKFIEKIQKKAVRNQRKIL